jgi:hypothetical protein
VEAIKEQIDALRAADNHDAAGERTVVAGSGPAESPDVREQFTEWLAREMPAGTVIGDPRWWAPKIIRAFSDYRTIARAKANTASPGTGELPELPDSFGDHCVTDSVRTMREPGYTAGQMRDYARAAMADSGRQAKVVEEMRYLVDAVREYATTTSGGAAKYVSGAMKMLDRALEALAAQPAPGAGDRVDAATALQSLADYFRRTSDLWEGPDGCADRGTVLCDEIRDRLEKLAREPMALGLTKIPPFPAARPAESVAQGGEASKVDTRRAPVQRYHDKTIPWRVHGLAWEAYAKKYGRAQSAERLAERGGFGIGEMDEFLPGWRDMAHAIDFPATPPPATGSDWYSRIHVTDRYTVDASTGALVQDQDGPWVMRSVVDAALRTVPATGSGCEVNPKGGVSI